jgi:hypothetical protein
MARANKITEYHAFTGNERPRDATYAGSFPVERETLCGQWEIDRAPENRRAGETGRTMLDATCRACAKAYGKAELKKVADRITIEKLEGLSQTKTAVIVSVDGTRRAVVSFPTGWGGHWEVYQFNEEQYAKHVADPKGGFTYGIRTNRQSGKIDDEFWSSHDVAKLAALPAYEVRNIHRMSQDAMISLVPALADAGRLPTRAEERVVEEERRQARIREDAERAEARNKAAEERARLDAIRAAERTHAVEALQSIMAKHGGVGGDLSNFDSEGLTIAMKLIGGVSAHG